MTDPTMTEAEIAKVRLASKIITAMNAMDPPCWTRLANLASWAESGGEVSGLAVDDWRNTSIVSAFREAAGLGLCCHCGWGADGRAWCRIRETAK